jgi:hypothetical protein
MRGKADQLLRRRYESRTRILGLGEQRPIGGQEELRAGGVQRRVVLIGAPNTVKLALGSDSNAAVNAGLLTKSCAKPAPEQGQRLVVEQRGIVEVGAKLDRAGPARC